MPEKKWIFDTVALSNFFLSDSIFLLEKRYRRRAVITWEVYDEISAGMAEYPKLKQIDSLIDAQIFKLASLSRKEHEHFRELIGHLGKGEASCIAYVKERKVIVVTDDRTARKQCSLMKIAVTGTIGILKTSVLDGQITLDRADEVLLNMIEDGFYSPIRSIADII
jgi:predicted nucleic acid-binding protein